MTSLRVRFVIGFLALTLAASLGAGAVGYWLAGSPAEAQTGTGTWQVRLEQIVLENPDTGKHPGISIGLYSMENYLADIPANCQVDYEFVEREEPGPYDWSYVFIAYACP